jgi:restriction system protein
VAIPDYQTLMLPILQLLNDQQDRDITTVERAMADAFGLTPDERDELLPSGVQRTLRNRVGWSLSYLTKAGLVSRPIRARYRITAAGASIAASGVEKLSARALKELDGYSITVLAHGKQTEVKGVAQGPHTGTEPQLLPSPTPEEQMEEGFRIARSQLVDDVRERLKETSPARFEQVVVDLLVAMGYGGASGEAGKVIGRSGDDGLDGVIKEDKLGLDHVYVQAKRWTANVSRPIVQAFAGSLEGVRARKGVMITTSDFTSEAREYVGRIEKRIVLIDGELLANYMIDYQIGVATVRTYSIKRIDNDYFEEA